MKKIILLALAMVTASVNAQDQDSMSDRNSEKNSEDFRNAKSTYLTFDMITPLYVVNPRYSFGVVQSFSPHWKMGVDVGFGSDEITVSTSDRRDQEDWTVYEIRLDAYRILNPTRLVQHYIGGEVFFNYHENRLVNYDYSPEDSSTEIDFDSADLERLKYGINLKYGVFIPFTDQFGMNIYVGAGIRVRDNKHTNVVNPRVDEFGDDDSWFERYHYEDGPKVRPNITAGFKLFYKFN